MNKCKKIKYLSGSSLIVLISLCFSIVFAGEADRDAQPPPPPKIVIDAPPPTQSPMKQESVETETVTIYESNMFPGFRPCTPEDHRNHDIEPVACQDEENASIISIREQNNNSEDLIVEDDVVPQGNIYKLKFERFKHKKSH